MFFQVDNRHNHPHDPLPEFIFVWTAKRYGLRDLVGTTRHDIAHAAQVYDDVPEVRTFLAFMLEDYDTEQLSFYLYARAVIHDRAATNDAEKALAAAFSHDSGARPPPSPFREASCSRSGVQVRRRRCGTSRCRWFTSS